MKSLLESIAKISAKLIGRHNMERLLVFSAKAINVNLHKHGLIQIGALINFDHERNGEAYFIKNILKQLLQNKPRPVFFDVGGNVGDYSLELRSHFPDAQIMAFEPVKNTFDLLAANTKGKNIDVHNFGFSDKAGTAEFYNTTDDVNNQIASIYKDVFEGVFNTTAEVSSTVFEIDTIDQFSERQQIGRIDFLKIDVEGHEYAVLSGALQMLSEKKIGVIQIEFNTHNIYSRVTLRDFYQLLSGFSFYRLHPQGLVDMGVYDAANEIYTAQNIVAIHQSLTGHLDKKHVLIYE